MEMVVFIRVVNEYCMQLGLVNGKYEWFVWVCEWNVHVVYADRMTLPCIESDRLCM